MFWQITSFPTCGHHVFLSHCAEDREDLVLRVYDDLQQRGVVPWLDQADYSYGRDSRTALRDGLLKSRHVVFFVTLAMMDHRRGWCPMELAYADLIQANLFYQGGPLLNVVLPLFFLDPADPELLRTVGGALRDRGRFHRPSDGDAALWAVDQIVSFLRREQELARELAEVAIPGRGVYDDLAGRPGLLARVTTFDPRPIPVL